MFAAETLVGAGLKVNLFDRMPSVGRKFLVAGSSGLNLTNALPAEEFPSRYTGPPNFWKEAIAEFTPEDLRSWALGMGIETYVGTSGKVFPVGQQAAPILRRWVARLRSLSATFHTRHRLVGITREPVNRWRAEFEDQDGEIVSHQCNYAILALGGASWPKTGSDGAWTKILEKAGVPIRPLTAANCGFDVNWPSSIVEKATGLPLKNISATSDVKTCLGECMITRHGIEGGIIYPLGPQIRRTLTLSLDLKPATDVTALITKLKKPKGALLSTARRRWNLSDAATALLAARGPWQSAEALAKETKDYRIHVTGSRPVEEAISSAGGVAWESLDEHLMIREMPGVFVAGEMIDWEAPTGGFLLQGAFATGLRAAQGVLGLER